MFRVSSKKRKKKAVTRLRPDSDEETDKQTAPNEAASVNQATQLDSEPKRAKDKSKKSKKKKKGLVVRSFEVGVGDDEDSPLYESSKKSRKRKRQGMGFGGAAKLTVHDDDDLPGNTDDRDIGDPSDLSYGQEALERLRQEQKYKTAVDEDETMASKAEEKESEKTVPSLSSQPNLERDHIDITKDGETASGPSLGEYIPLNGKEPSMILAGDEALEFDNRRNNEMDQTGTQHEEHFDSVMEDSNFLDTAENQQQAREASAWEAEITRRAGLPDRNKTSSGRDHHAANVINQKSSSGELSNNSATSLAKLRSQFESTIAQLESQMSDVDRACQRRRVELSQTKTELERQENDLKESGKALDEYQQLREDVTFWAGALRDLKSKVTPIQEALIDLDADIANPAKHRDWEDDMCAILHQAGLLDRVLGRQPPDFVFEETTTFLDEFGRDVKSQHAMHREKRIRRLLEIQGNHIRSTNESDLEAFMDEHDAEAFHERRVALDRALGVALDDLEQEYTLLPRLASIFHKWQSSYPDDFKQCFAYLSLGDLTSVLVQVELCRLRPSGATYKGWLEGWSCNDEESTDAVFGWVRDLSLSESEGKSKSYPSMPSDELIDRVIENCYCPILNQLLDKAAYDVVSDKQSHSLSAVYGRLSKLVGSRHHVQLSAVTRKIFDYIKKSIDCVALPVLNGVEPKFAEGEDSRYEREELQIALHGATDGQLRRMTKMLVNIVTYWSPYLSSQEGGGDVVEFVLDFLSSKYLFLLSSLRGRSTRTSEEFSLVWAVLQKTQWLDQPGRMLQAAPLRAAAVAFKVV